MINSDLIKIYILFFLFLVDPFHRTNTNISWNISEPVVHGLGNAVLCDISALFQLNTCFMLESRK
jgi:hypothetical protein